MLVHKSGSNTKKAGPFSFYIVPTITIHSECVRDKKSEGGEVKDPVMPFNLQAKCWVQRRKIINTKLRGLFGSEIVLKVNQIF